MGEGEGKWVPQDDSCPHSTAPAPPHRTSSEATAQPRHSAYPSDGVAALRFENEDDRVWRGVACRAHQLSFLLRPTLRSHSTVQPAKTGYGASGTVPHSTVRTRREPRGCRSRSPRTVEVSAWRSPSIIVLEGAGEAWAAGPAGQELEQELRSAATPNQTAHRERLLDWATGLVVAGGKGGVQVDARVQLRVLRVPSAGCSMGEVRRMGIDWRAAEIPRRCGVGCGLASSRRSCGRR